MRQELLERLHAMGYELPAVAKAVGMYVPAVRCGYMVMTSGQLPIRDGKLLYTGKVGKDLSIEQAQEAARIAALNALAAAGQAAGGFERLRRVFRLAVFVNSAEGFTDQAQVANGPSQLIKDLLGEQEGEHARVAVGVAELPLNAAVEVELWACCAV